MRPHISAQDGVDAGLVASLLLEPAEQVGVEPHGHNFFRRRHYDFGRVPYPCAFFAQGWDSTNIEP
jgi:hypothetical protein